jgi:hypothetical protein
MVEYSIWFKKNEVILDHLYYTLLNICCKNKFNINDNEKCYNYFLKMMYNQSNKTIINKELFSEYFEISYLDENYIKE